MENNINRFCLVYLWMVKMTDFVKMLTRKNSLRKQCQELTAAEIEKVVTDLTLILEEKRESEQAMIAAEQERLDKIDAIRKSMQEAGIELDDLMGMVETTTKKKLSLSIRLLMKKVSSTSGLAVVVHRLRSRSILIKVFQGRLLN
ncbi:H-NS family histone-like protein [Aliamphritea spongicola]